MSQIVNFDIMSEPTWEFRQLQYFGVLAEELHFGNAAARLGVAQPALSQAIRRLEQRLGFALFSRTSRRVRLTPQGGRILASTERVLRELRRGLADAREIAAGRTGGLTIGHTALSMLTVLPAVLRRYRQAQPAVRLSFRELSSAQQLDQLQAGYLDVAIVSGTFEGQGVATLELRRDPLIVVLHRSHRLAGRRSLPISQLASEPFILFPREQIPPVYDQILELCRASGFEPAIAHVAQSWHLIAALVGLGLGISIVPLSVQRYLVKEVRAVPIRPQVAVATTLGWLPDASTGATSPFIAAAREVVAQLKERG
jgi:DNA-binding transcriptional LysR family regulator